MSLENHHCRNENERSNLTCCKRRTKKGKPKVAGHCKTCGKAFLGSSGRNYCGEGCWPTSIKPPKQMGTCEHCGKPTHVNGLRRFCSNSCSREAYGQAKVTPKTSGTCQRCGKDFLGRPDQKYCHANCRNKACREAKPAKPSPIVMSRECLGCGKVFDTIHPSQVRCSASCGRYRRCSANEYAKRRSCKSKRHALLCQHCGESFMAFRKDSLFCGDKCRMHKARNCRRAMERNAYVEPVGIGFLLKRDKCVCQLCGTLVAEQMIVPHPLSPTIDHVIPLSKGGLHSKSNCQLAHFHCNSVKKDRLIANFSLAPPP